ncbi:hypothetical protein Sjap_016567 [Stephania japonica]|uniref:Uncharacterized protein n=1 Tax=Stephania japonica TaxID=461633 RepID=A0AAP0ILT7_9MAGN
MVVTGSDGDSVTLVGFDSLFKILKRGRRKLCWIWKSLSLVETLGDDDDDELFTAIDHRSCLRGVFFSASNGRRLFRFEPDLIFSIRFRSHIDRLSKTIPNIVLFFFQARITISDTTLTTLCIGNFSKPVRWSRAGRESKRGVRRKT